MAKGTKYLWDESNSLGQEDMRASYLPSKTEIRNACLKIQANWTVTERASREACSKEWVDGLFFSLPDLPTPMSRKTSRRLTGGARL